MHTRVVRCPSSDCVTIHNRSRTLTFQVVTCTRGYCRRISLLILLGVQFADGQYAMKRINWFTGCCLVALAFAGAAVFESTRQSVRGTVAFDGLLYTTKSSSNPKLQLWPLDGLDIATFLICAVCLSLAGGAGIGGGAVLVPCFILIRGACLQLVWIVATATARLTSPRAAITSAYGS